MCVISDPSSFVNHWSSALTWPEGPKARKSRGWDLNFLDTSPEESHGSTEKGEERSTRSTSWWLVNVFFFGLAGDSKTWRDLESEAHNDLLRDPSRTDGERSKKQA